MSSPRPGTRFPASRPRHPPGHGLHRRPRRPGSIYLGLKPEQSLTLQYALRPTCAGTFIVPPPYAEDMYDAKVRANGAAGKLIILPRE